MNDIFKTGRILLLAGVASFYVMSCNDQNEAAEEPNGEMDIIDPAQRVADEEKADTLEVRRSKDSLRIKPGAKDQHSTHTNPRWRLVVSSQPSERRAERFAERMGNKEAEVLYVDYLDTYRVVYQSFDDLKEAQGQFQKVQQDYPEAWLVFY